MKARNTCFLAMSRVVGSIALTWLFCQASWAGVYPTIKDYGAVCDGITDDTAAIQAALNATKIVHIPAESNYCIVNNTITIPAGSSLVADASGINFNGAANCFKTSQNIDMFSIAAGYVTLRGVCFRHGGGTGRILSDNGLKMGMNIIENVGFTATSNTNLSDLVYFESSANTVRGAGFNNLRTSAYAIRFDAKNGTPRIGNRIESSFFGGTQSAGAGLGIYAGSSDASTRQEGVFVKNNFFVLQGGSNLHLGSILSAHVEGNEFDQAWSNNVVLEPNSGQGLSRVSFVGNWFSTPNQPTNGNCVVQQKSNPVSDISFVGNHFGWCGNGIALNSAASNIVVQGNTFSVVGQNALKFDETKNVTISGNQFNALGGAGHNNLWLKDGAAGGPFSITGNQFDAASDLATTATNPANFRYDRSNAGKVFAGYASTVVPISSCASQYFNVAHGLAGTPQLGRIMANIVKPASGGAAITTPTAYVVFADATNITVNFQCGLLVAGGNIQINIDASL